MVLNTIFAPILQLSPTVGVFVFSLFIMLIINGAQKLLINHKEVKKIRARVKEFNAQIKQAQKSEDKPKVDNLFSQMMAENNKMMGMTMKPMIVSLVLVFLFLPWMGDQFGDFDVDQTGSVTIDGIEYSILTEGNEAIIGNTRCTMPCKEVIGDFSWIVSQENGNVKLSRIVAFLPFSLPILGTETGWLGWYFLSSLPIGMLLRKLLKISM